MQFCYATAGKEGNLIGERSILHDVDLLFEEYEQKYSAKNPANNKSKSNVSSNI